MDLICEREPAEIHEAVWIHEHEDVKGLLVREAIKPNRVLFVQGANVCLQEILEMWKKDFGTYHVVQRNKNPSIAFSQLQPYG